MPKPNWNDIKYFKRVDFSEDPDKFSHPMTIQYADYSREALKERAFPSPVPGAVARMDGSDLSTHFIGTFAAPVRKSTALDLFFEGYPIMNFTELLKLRLWNGIGIYIHTKGNDGKKWVMFHLDIREKANPNIQYPLIWICKKVKQPDNTFKNVYVYNYQEEFVELLRSPILFKDKKFGLFPGAV